MDDLVSKFINFFFPPSKTTNLRNEITNFRQIAQESFSEAWERFKELLRKCPHHGFSLMHQLDTFYNSLSYNDQDSLNSAAGGNFLYKSHEGYKYRGNLRAKVRCSRNAVMRVSTNAPPPSSNSSSNFEFQQMAAALEDKMTLTFRNEMNEMKNMMKALVPTPVPINAGWRRCTTCGSNHSFNVCPRLERVRVPVYHDNFHNVKQTLRLVILLTWKMRIPSSQISEPYSPLVFLQTKVNHPIKGISLIKEWYLTKRSTTKFSIVLANQLDNFQENTEGSMQITNGFPKQFAKAFCWWFLSKSKPTFYFYFYGTYTLPSNTITNPRKNDGTKDKVLPSTKTSTSGYPKILCPVKSVSSPNSPEPSSAQVDNSPPSKEPSKKNRLPYPSRVEHEKKESKIGKDCDFSLGDDFQSFKTFSNPLFEKKDDFPSRNDESILKEEVHKETPKSHLNPLFEKDEEIISNEVSRQISPKVDVKTIVSFFSQIGNCVRKWATNEFVKDNDEFNHEVFKSDNEMMVGNS
ncbi:reverse transcriptase domain-containing protein [Tanacetum coccineum]